MRLTDAALDALVHNMPFVRSKVRRASVVWRYLGGPRTRAKHALDISGGHTGHVNVARCGLYSWSSAIWMGTGSQDEYDRVDQLPECKSCCRTLAG
jgi:hypothetical protein